jgi:hypothetical protein
MFSSCPVRLMCGLDVLRLGWSTRGLRQATVAPPFGIARFPMGHQAFPQQCASGRARHDPEGSWGALLGCRPAIDDQLAPGDEGRLIGGEVQHAVGDILWPSYAAQGYPIEPLLA